MTFQWDSYILQSENKSQDSWKEIPAHRRFYIEESNTWWDLSFLLNHIVQQLNQCSMGSSYPVFPSDPFTRQKYSVELLKKIKIILFG